MTLPPAVRHDELPLRYRVDWSRPGDGRVVAFLRLEVAKGELTSEETAAFQGQLRRLLDVLAQGALHDAPPPTR